MHKLEKIFRADIRDAQTRPFEDAYRNRQQPGGGSRLASFAKELPTADRIESAGPAVHVLFVLLFTLWLKSDKTFCAGARL